VEPAGLRTPIIMLRHIARTRAKQILSPCVIVLQVALARAIELRHHMTVFFNGFLLRSARILDIFDCRFKLVIFKVLTRLGEIRNVHGAYDDNCTLILAGCQLTSGSPAR
jgi:hypothetical protein